MKILAVETSCDDTCISVLKVKNGNFEFLSDIVSSQTEVHKKWGGVYPTLARREHQKNLVPVLEKTLKEAGLLKKGNSSAEIKDVLKREEILLKKTEKFLSSYKKPEVDLLAVTVGPGLDPSLWMGINFIKALAKAWQLEIIPVNHIKAHFFAPMVLKDSPFPAVSLIASGGHTQLVFSENLNTHRVLGKTRDDAAGECFDKTARILGLDYPGGPEIEKLAKKDSKKEVKFPRPMMKSDNYDFSFSGLKTAVLYKWKDEKDKSENFRVAMAEEIQEAITDVLTEKTFRAAENRKAKAVILGGGVSANERLREKFKKRAESKKLSLILPNLDFSTDNAKMIAVTAYHEWKKGGETPWKELKSKPNLKIN